MELADVTDSKSVDGNIVWVRVPPPAPRKSPPLSERQRRLFRTKRSAKRNVKHPSDVKRTSCVKNSFNENKRNA